MEEVVSTVVDVSKVQDDENKTRRVATMSQDVVDQVERPREGMGIHTNDHMV